MVKIDPDTEGFAVRGTGKARCQTNAIGTTRRYGGYITGEIRVFRAARSIVNSSKGYLLDVFVSDIATLGRTVAYRASGTIWSSTVNACLLTILDAVVAGRAYRAGRSAAVDTGLLTILNTVITGRYRGTRSAGAAAVNAGLVAIFNAVITGRTSATGTSTVDTGLVTIFNAVITGWACTT